MKIQGNIVEIWFEVWVNPPEDIPLPPVVDPELCDIDMDHDPIDSTDYAYTGTNNVDCEEFTISCAVDGYVYLDIENDDLMNGTDVPQSWIAVSLDNGDTTMTNDDGYYMFEDLNCEETYVVTYVNDTIYRPDSSQEDETINTNPVTPLSITVTADEFVSPYKTMYTDEDNNFGLVWYNLVIDKTFIKNVDQAGQERSLEHNALPAIESWDRVYFELEFTNEWPTTAKTVTVKDMYPVAMSDFVLESQSGPSVLAMNDTGTELEFAIWDMSAWDTYIVEVSAIVVGWFEDEITNTATIYTADETNDLIEEYDEPERFEDNEDEEKITIVSCGVDGRVYVDIAWNDMYDSTDISLDDIQVTITQQDPNTATNEMQTTVNGMYALDGLSCRHEVVVSYVEDTLFTPDSSQIHQDIQQVEKQTLTVSALQLDGDESVDTLYEEHFVSEDNNFWLLWYALMIDKQFVSNEFDGVAYPKMDGTMPIIESGDTVWYDITFANTKTTLAEGVRVLDKMPTNMAYVNAVVTNGAETDLTIAHDASTNILDIYVWDMEVGAMYTVRVETVVTGSDADEITNSVSIYTDQEQNDPIEFEHDEEQFEDNEDEVVIRLEHCTTDGLMYLDIADDDRYTAGEDVLISDQAVSFKSIHEEFEQTTNADGYYMFDEHSCRFDVVVSYTNTTEYRSDSSQLEVDTDVNDDVMSIDVPVSTYIEEDDTSLWDNFGLVLYDLSITKEILRQEQYSKNITLVRDTEVMFELVVRNNGDTAASNMTITDVYDIPHLMPDLNWIVYVSTPDGVDTSLVSATIVDDTIVMTGFPKFMVGEEYVIQIPFTTMLEDEEESTYVENLAMVYVWDPKTDPIEALHVNEFTNNEDKVDILIAKMPESTWGTKREDPIVVVIEEEPMPELEEEEEEILVRIIEVKKEISLPELKWRNIFEDSFAYGTANLPEVLPKTGVQE